MGWKDWPYWLKGGIVGLCIVIILLIIFFAFIKDSGACLRKFYNPTRCMIEQILSAPLFIGSIPIALVIRIVAEDIHPSIWMIVFAIWNTIFFFLIGSLIGLIIGKIKPKNIPDS